MVSNPFSQGLAVKVSGDTSGATQALSSLRGSLVSTKTAVAGLGVALGAVTVGALAKSAKSFADFDEAMQESLAVMGDVSEGMEDKLADKAREVANTTTASAEESAEAFYFLASAGLAAEESLEAMPQVAAFAEAGNLEMAKATDFATDIMKAFGKEAEDLTMVTDRLTATVTRHNQTMNGMGQAMSMVAPVASGLGVDIGETATLIGLLGDAGIKGSRAGRTLRQAFKKLTDVSGPAQKVLDKLGVSVKDSNGQMREMSAIIRDLNKAGASTADVMKIFGARAGPGMQVLLDQGAAAIEKETKAIKSMDGATKNVAQTQRDTFNKQLQIFMSRLNDIAITIGSRLMPHLNALLGRLLELTNKFTGSNKQLSENAKLAINLGKNIAAILLPALKGIGFLLGKVGDAFNSLSLKQKKLLITGLTAAFGILAGPIGAVGAAIVIAANHWDFFKGIINSVIGAIDTLHESLKDLWTFITENAVVETLGNIGNAIPDVGGVFNGNPQAQFTGAGPGPRGQNTNVQVTVEGDTDVVRDVTAKEISSRERRGERQSGRTPNL